MEVLTCYDARCLMPAVRTFLYLRGSRSPVYSPARQALWWVDGSEAYWDISRTIGNGVRIGDLRARECDHRLYSEGLLSVTRLIDVLEFIAFCSDIVSSSKESLSH